MPEITLPSPDLTLHCDLCRRICPAGQMPLRGKLNFCQACATERPRECLAHFDRTGSKSRWPAILLAVLSLGLIAGVVLVALKKLPLRDSADSQRPPARSELAPGAPSSATIAPATDPAHSGTVAT